MLQWLFINEMTWIATTISYRITFLSNFLPGNTQGQFFSRIFWPVFVIKVTGQSISKMGQKQANTQCHDDLCVIFTSMKFKLLNVLTYAITLFGVFVWEVAITYFWLNHFYVYKQYFEWIRLSNSTCRLFCGNNWLYIINVYWLISWTLVMRDERLNSLVRFIAVKSIR